MPSLNAFAMPQGEALLHHTRRQEPANGLNALDASQLASCRAALEPHWLPGQGPVMLSYATSVSTSWMLGLSAARHGLPLVLAGLNQPRWPWWQGGRKKLPGSRRALQVIHALSPDRPVISSDTGDLLIGNKLTAKHRAVLAQVAAGRRMLIAAECNSWPICYRDAYAKHPEYQSCLTSHSACFPNSGVLLASTSTLLRFYDRWADSIVNSGQLGKAERWNDQAAVHRLYQNRSAHATDEAFDLQVDADNLFSLQLWKCEGATAKASGKHYKYCHEKPFDPTTGLRTRPDGEGVTFTDERGFAQRPFLVHSNGHHYVLRQEASHLRPLLDLYQEPNFDPALFDHKVVLVDSYDHGACNVTTLGWLMNYTRFPAGAPSLRFRAGPA